jgi:TRAP-type uncharacterized transport system substrate-binding protein
VLALAFLGILWGLFLNPNCWPPVHAAPAPAANVQQRPTGVVTDTPSITIAGATATTTRTPTTTAHEAQIQWTFGTVVGSYGTCTVQAKTSYDGVNFLTLGSAVTVTATTGAVNAWTILEQGASESALTTSAVSSTAALGFGQATEFTFACSTYGTSAPVTVVVIYR